MDKNIAKNNRKFRRKQRTRSKISGTSECPRLSVYKSNRYIYAQLIDDLSGKTLVSAHSQVKKSAKAKKDEALGQKTAAAFETGKTLAEKAKAANISMVVFDRGSFQYHGRVKALAEGAREGGLIF